MHRRTLATRDAAWAIHLAGWLARRHVTPNTVSVLGVVCATAAGASFALTPMLMPRWRAATLLIAAACVQLRLLCNLLDGMLAVEQGLKTRTGELFNELPDRIADVVILTGAGCSALEMPAGVALGSAAALAALFTAYVRVLAGSLGTTQHFIGPMAKQHRMFTLTLAALVAALEVTFARPPHAMLWGLVVIIAGSAITIVRRTARMAGELSR
jgi:phosphatidylglycerophosphate synthase